MIAILAAVAAPPLRTTRDRAEAARIVADLRTVRDAALAHHAETGTWAATAPPGAVPDALVPYLPADVRFERERYRLQWRHVPGPDSAAPPHLVGVTVQGAERLQDLVAVLLGGGPDVATVAGSVTWAAEGSPRPAPPPPPAGGAPGPGAVALPGDAPD